MFLNSIGLTETTPVIHNLNNPNLELKFNKLIEISKKDNPDENLVLSALHSLLYTIKESIIDRHHKQKTNDRNVAIDNAIQYIKENYAKDISLQDLASIAHLDKIYFTKKFKKATRLSPIQFLIQYRISQSCNMLHSSLPLKSIAIQCCFKNLTNFLRHFKDFIGLTPTQYRKNITPPKKNNLKKTNYLSH